MPPGKFQGCGRGVFGLSNWNANRPVHPETIDRINAGLETQERRPTAPTKQPIRTDASVPTAPTKQPIRTDASNRENSQQGNETRSDVNQNNGKSTAADTNQPKRGSDLLVKYTYKANHNSPLGKEVSMKQKDKVKFVSISDKYPDDWWMIETADGQRGYVPATYVMEVQVTSLPWLQNRPPAPEPEETVASQGSYKGYTPTYKHAGIKERPSGPEEKADNWYCQICEKRFNGVHPYNSHMASKAHKEELEIAKDYGRA